MQNITIVFNETGHKTEINIERRLTYLTGLSGVGKSTFVTLLQSGDVLRFTISSSLPLVYLYDFNNLDLIIISKKSILIVDDYASLQSTNFWQLVNEHLIKNNCWLLIVGREYPYEDRTIPYVSFSSVYKMHAIDGEFSASKLSIMSKRNLSGKTFDKIYVEDSASGFDFVKELNNTKASVESLNGASNLMKRLKELLKNGIRRIRIFAFVDMASFGVGAAQIENLLSYKVFSGFEVCIMSDYECFEELLLRTNIFAGKFIEDVNEANEYLSWERYFEAKLNELTKNKLYRAYHGHMTDCYTKDCCYLDKKSLQGTKCEFYNSVKDKKFDFLLKGTKYERLLEFHKG